MKSYPLTYENIINDPNVSEEQKIQEKNYKAYIDNHKKNVVETWEELKNLKIIHDFILKTSNDPNIDKKLNERALNHDNSKFSEEEWEPYRKRFFFVNINEKNSGNEEFQKAWSHHKENNSHHNQYWEDTNQVDKMPFIDVVEMCCDWISMSKARGGNALEWYHSQKNLVLGNKQKEWTLFILNEYYKNVGNNK